MYALVSSDDIGRKIFFPIRKVRTMIGRDGACDIVLADDNVSRQHVKIYLMENRIEIKDMGSRNGTFLNNERLSGMKELKVGDEVIVGSNQFHLVFDPNLAEQSEGMTGIRTVDQLRDPASGFDVRPGQAAPPSAVGNDPAESTIFASRENIIADIYGKKLALAQYPSIEVIFGKNRGQRYLLQPGRYVVGRGSGSNIRLDDEKVSNAHGALEVKAGEAHYEDLGSTNGSILNNKLLKKRALLRHKDLLLLGHSKLKYLDLKNRPQVARINTQPDEESEGGNAIVKYLPWVILTLFLAGLGGWWIWRNFF
jgi:pSer/pThr/pTyr-binding forkhead associated (FHA) protein